MIVVLLCGIVFLLLGVAHYAGYAKPLAFASIFSPYLLLGVAWLGAAALLGSLGLLLSDAGLEMAAALVALPAMVCFGIALLSIVWLPRRLRPRWLQGWIERGRPVEEVRRWPRWNRGQTW
jgi:hypothetical protein